METQQDIVELRIPRKPEYVSVARLAISGIASRMNFSYDEVEDIKLAVGEACASAMADTAPEGAIAPIIVRCDGNAERICVDVINPASAGGSGVEEGIPPDEPISRLLMEVLMDEVEVTEDSEGNVHMRMIKLVPKEEG